MNKECPLCKSKKIRLKDVRKVKENDEAISYTSIRLYCKACKRAMTVTGILVSTTEEVDK